MLLKFDKVSEICLYDTFKIFAADAAAKIFERLCLPFKAILSILTILAWFSTIWELSIFKIFWLFLFNPKDILFVGKFLHLFINWESSELYNR